MDEVQKRVLIVEDDELISKVYEIKLVKEGLSVVHAHDGEEAVKMVLSEKPNIIILDLMLPKKDGFWVIGEIKKNPDFSKIPILVISNLGQKVDETRVLALGATEYLVKVDHSIQEIVDKVKKYLAVPIV